MYTFRAILIFSMLITSSVIKAQFLLERNEDKKAKAHFIEEVAEHGLREDPSATDTLKANKSPFPIVNFGSDISAGSKAIGFRPAVLGSTSLSGKFFYLQPSIRLTQVDDQKFDLEKTGQTLFVKEIANFSVSFDALLAIPAEDSNYNVSRFGFTGGFSFRGNSLFNLDSTNFKSVKNDISIVNIYLGAEVIAYWEHLSFYHTWNMMSVTNNRNIYHAYFRPEAQKDFIYPQLGMKFKVLEGKEEFKNLIVDFSTLWIGKRMKTIVGNNSTIIPILKVGYVQRIETKHSGKKE